jgi:hypothetical protein
LDVSDFHSFCATLVFCFKNTPAEGFAQLEKKPSTASIPAWSAGIQTDMDVSGGILANPIAGHPCRHDEDLHFRAL